MRLVLAAAASFLIATSAMAGPVATGFSTNTLGHTDDGFTSAVALGFSANFFGTTYNSVYVNNNGNLTFNAGQSSYSPTGLGAGYAGQPIIAPFFADVDTTGANSSLTSYGTGTYAGHAAFGVTWPGVGYWYQNSDRLNTFQVILTDRSDTGAGNFDIYFNYDSIQWDQGQASDTSAVAGYNAGNQAPGTFFELPGSLVSGALVDGGPDALASTTNTGTPGQHLFTVRDGSVAHSVPEPATLLLMGAGLAALAGMRRKGLI